MTVPMRVRRGSSLVVQLASRSASARMERNLSILKGLASMPMRSCTKKTGPGESSLIRIAVSIISGDAKRRKRLLPRMSATRLSVSFHPRKATSRMVSRGSPARSLIVTSEAMI